MGTSSEAPRGGLEGMRSIAPLLGNAEAEAEAAAAIEAAAETEPEGDAAFPERP